MQTKLSEWNRNPSDTIKEINRLKHQVNNVTGISGNPKIIGISTNEVMNIRRINGNVGRFTNDFVDKSLTLIWNINIHKLKIWMNNKKEWMEANNTKKKTLPKNINQSQQISTDLHQANRTQRKWCVPSTHR